LASREIIWRLQKESWRMDQKLVLQSTTAKKLRCLLTEKLCKNLPKIDIYIIEEV
jgi:hypothetical protein